MHNVEILHQPFSNLQLELLKLYADNISDEDLKVIRRLIAQYFASKASDEADEIWEREKFDLEEMRNAHFRSASSVHEKLVA